MMVKIGWELQRTRGCWLTSNIAWQDFRDGLGLGVPLHGHLAARIDISHAAACRATHRISSRHRPRRMDEGVRLTSQGRAYRSTWQECAAEGASTWCTGSGEGLCVPNSASRTPASACGRRHCTARSPSSTSRPPHRRLAPRQHRLCLGIRCTYTLMHRLCLSIRCTCCMHMHAHSRTGSA